MKPGWKTTEFWLTVATNVAALIQTIAGVLQPNEAAIAMVIVNGLYALSRGHAKNGNGGTK